MRPSRTQSRSMSRAKSPAPSLLTRSMKLPLITNGGFGGTEELTQPSSMWSNAPRSNGYSIGVCSQQGKRPYQEDEYSIRPFLNASKPGSDLPETHFFGLFDGHAGGKCSQHMATNLANTLLDDESFVTNLPQAIKRTYYTANEQFLKIAEKLKLHDGSTGICAIIRDNKILVANAGDCRCLLISNGRPIQLSNDHKPTSPDEQKRINALGGQVVYCMGVARVNRVLAVSRAFGNRTLRTVIRPDAELMQRELADGDDFLVIASDGLWDVLKNKDVSDVCYSPFLQRKSQAIADELVQLAMNKGSMDNVTCIVVNLTDYRNKSMVLKEDPFTFHGHKNDGAEIVFNKNKELSDTTGGMYHKNANKNSGIENNNLNNSIILNDEEDDDNATQVDIATAISAQHQAFRKLNIVNNGMNPKSNSNNNNLSSHEIPNRQLSMGNFHNHENDNMDTHNNVSSPSVGGGGNNGVRKQMIGITRTPLVKANSSSSINVGMEIAAANNPNPNATNFPNVSNNTPFSNNSATNSSNPDNNNNNNRLFTSTDPLKMNLTAQKPMSRGVGTGELAQQHKASFAPNIRSSRNPSGLILGGNGEAATPSKGLLTMSRDKGGNEQPSRIRSSLGDLSSYINDFNASVKPSFL